jgi:hypothetical protein
MSILLLAVSEILIKTEKRNNSRNKDPELLPKKEE